MLRIECEACEAKQPTDWQQGQLCTECGSIVREEVRCAWCVNWTPQGKFCRGCGSELVPAEYYAAARMLKKAGVDQYTLVKRLQELDPEQITHFKRIYDLHYAMVLRSVEDVYACQQYLVQSIHAQKLEDQLLVQLPFVEDEFQRYKDAYKMPLKLGIESLCDISQNNIQASTQKLAYIALLRSGHFFTFDTDVQGQIIYDVLSWVDDQDVNLAREAMFVLNHWYFQFPYYQELLAQYNPNFQRWLELAEPCTHNDRSGLWSAVACCLADPQQLAVHEYQLQLGISQATISQTMDSQKSGLLDVSSADSGDQDLRLVCALLLDHVEVLMSYVHKFSTDAALIAAMRLARVAPDLLCDYITHSPREHLQFLLVHFVLPLPSGVSHALLALMMDTRHENTQQETEQFLAILAQQLDDHQLDRLCLHAQARNDSHVFDALLYSPIKNKSVVIRFIVDNGFAYTCEESLCAVITEIQDIGSEIDDALLITMMQSNSELLTQTIFYALKRSSSAPSMMLLRSIEQFCNDAQSSFQRESIALYVQHASESLINALIDKAKRDNNSAFITELLQQNLQDPIYAIHCALDLGLIDMLASTRALSYFRQKNHIEAYGEIAQTDVISRLLKTGDAQIVARSL